MGKPSPTRDTSFSWNYMPRHVAQKVAMHQQSPQAANAFIPKITKQDFAIDLNVYIRTLKWKAQPAVLFQERNKSCRAVGCNFPALN